MAHHDSTSLGRVALRNVRSVDCFSTRRASVARAQVTGVRQSTASGHADPADGSSNLPDQRAGSAANAPGS
jgi:hypothetical protein